MGVGVSFQHHMADSEMVSLVRVLIVFLMLVKGISPSYPMRRRPPNPVTCSNPNRHFAREQIKLRLGVESPCEVDKHGDDSFAAVAPNPPNRGQKPRVVGGKEKTGNTS